jgi:hypothetical protein
MSLLNALCSSIRRHQSALLPLLFNLCKKAGLVGFLLPAYRQIVQ